MIFCVGHYEPAPDGRRDPKKRMAETSNGHTCAQSLEAWLQNIQKDNEKDRTSALQPTQPNAPAWGQNVHVFDATSDAQALEQQIAELLANVNPLSDGSDDGQNGHFSDERHALLFKPGDYDIDVQVGYYTQVLGLGASPSEVTFKGGTKGYGPYVLALDQRSSDDDGTGSLNTFWRSVENVKIQTSNAYWAVSQAAPMRRIEVDGTLWFFDSLTSGCNFASGGFAADIYVKDSTTPGSQQQFCLRNCTFGGDVSRCAWSLVQCGCDNALATTSCDDYLVYNQPRTKIIAEKPYITVVQRPVYGDNGQDTGDTEDAYLLHVPRLKKDSAGVSFAPSDDAVAAKDLVADSDDVIPFEYVFYADADALGVGSVATSIQAQLDAGYSIVFAPGTFQLEQTLEIKTNDQVLLGIGMATLKPPADGSPCLRVASDVEGVRIAGLTLQSSKLDDGSFTGSTLLDWCATSNDSSSANPGVLSDIFARVGGPDKTDRYSVGVDIMLRIAARDVIADNLWLWRADHSALADGEQPQEGQVFHLVTSGEFPCNTAIQVSGDNVSIYGLACEHTIQNITQWSGNHGTVLFYQCELPYDVTQAAFGDPGYAGYIVDDSVETHTAAGVGIYSYFRDYDVLVKSAFLGSADTSQRMYHTFTRFLNKSGKGGIENVINDQGGSSYQDTDSPKVYIWP